MTFGVLSLCSHLGAIQIEVRLSDAALTQEDRLSAEQDFTPNAILFLATVFGHMTILWDMWLTFGVLRPLWNWGIAAAAVLTLDSASVVVTAVQVGAKVSAWNDINRTTLCADHNFATEDTGISDLTANPNDACGRKYGTVHSNGTTRHRRPCTEHQALPFDISDASTLVCSCLPRQIIRFRLTTLQAPRFPVDMAILERRGPACWGSRMSVCANAYHSLPLALLTR